MDLIVKILGLFKNKGCFIKIERMLNGNCYSSVDRGDWLSTHEELVSDISRKGLKSQWASFLLAVGQPAHIQETSVMWALPGPFTHETDM